MHFGECLQWLSAVKPRYGKPIAQPVYEDEPGDGSDPFSDMGCLPSTSCCYSKRMVEKTHVSVEATLFVKCSDDWAQEKLSSTTWYCVCQNACRKSW